MLNPRSSQASSTRSAASKYASFGVAHVARNRERLATRQIARIVLGEQVLHQVDDQRVEAFRLPVVQVSDGVDEFEVRDDAPGRVALNEEGAAFRIEQAPPVVGDSQRIDRRRPWPRQGNLGDQLLRTVRLVILDAALRIAACSCDIFLQFEFPTRSKRHAPVAGSRTNRPVALLHVACRFNPDDQFRPCRPCSRLRTSRRRLAR